MSVDRVNFQYDGLALNPLETSELLHTILKSNNIPADSYSMGGAVETLEKEMAAILGKESSIFMPSGTLANHLALRNLSPIGQRIIVQENSHIYNDSGDCLQSLSGRNLLPLKADNSNRSAGFSLEQVVDSLGFTNSGKVRTGVGTISIESPVRRMNGMMFSRDEMVKISSFAKDNGIKTHLDGARLFIASAWSGLSPAEYADEFDTVYVSLYKYFNAPFGAILAGPGYIIDELYHQRRMFGGGLNEAWPSAVLALDSLENFESRYQKVIELTREFKESLNSIDEFYVEDIPNGTNVFALILNKKIDPDSFREHLLRRKIILPVPDNKINGFYLKTNESILVSQLDMIIREFKEALLKS